MGCESNLRHWIILIFFSMKIKHFYRSWVYNQYTLTAEDIDTAAGMLPDAQEDILGMLYEGNLIGIELPTTVSLKIVETAPAIKSASASSRTKPATLETGLLVQVPEYLADDELIKVNTSTRKFSSRA
ncbi:MAG: hypothetical protein LC437_09205, partial [Thiohalomonas sp.]|nr:hypothetical protein [Thiohalomonas sp.]